MATANPHEESAREAKAQRLAHRAVQALLLTAADSTTERGAQFWKALLEDEQTKGASPETRARVVQILQMLRPVKMEGWNL